MFEVAVELSFAAAHALRGYQGKCEQIHGHNYRVRATLEGEQVDANGLLVDFVDVKRLLKRSIEYLDHRFVNELPPFDRLNPTAENMARYFYEELERALGGEGQRGVRLKEVTVWETDTSLATYRR
jgi:6-pyruvoyltetrahydropterin/6-carboxytetrahydropterin synthase